jgi:phage terminase large subunit GpA-like protein
MSAPATKYAALSEISRSTWGSLWIPPARLPLSQWAEQNLILSSEYSASIGPIKLYGWQKAPLDSFTDPRVETTVLMCSTQMLKTLMIQAALAYSISQQPGPTLVVEPKDGDAKSFSKERLAPMIRDCPALKVVSDAKGRSSSNTILEKTFPGGTLAVVGAIAPGNLARRSIRYLFCDEVDKYPPSAGSEGDPIALARERTVTFGTRRKIVLCCSPTEAGRSRIGKAYDDSDRQKPWAPCPSCGEFQILKWGQVVYEPVIGYKCIACGMVWDDQQRRAACELVEWRAQAPFRGTAGFWISHLYSPWKRLADMVGDYESGKADRQLYKTFVNTTLAELWEEEGETPDEELLYAKAEDYPFGDETIVPARGLFLTAAVDVQDNPPRLEVEIKAWGRGRENWSLDHRSIQVLAENGQPLPVTSPELWEKLDREVLRKDYRHANGHVMPIMVMVIDTGNRPKPVYDFALGHARPSYSGTGLHVIAPRTVVPIKGTPDGLRVISSISKEDAARKRQGVRIVGIGTHCVKTELYDAFRHIKPHPDGQAVPGCNHFPRYEKTYFEGLCSEKRVVKERTGEVSWEKRPNVRNEPLDLAVYNRGAAAIFGIDRMTDAQWRKFEEALAPVDADKPAPSEETGKPAQRSDRERWIPKKNWFPRG